jgi:hypothetical protein
MLLAASRGDCRREEQGYSSSTQCRHQVRPCCSQSSHARHSGSGSRDPMHPGFQAVLRPSDALSGTSVSAHMPWCSNSGSILQHGRATFSAAAAAPKLCAHTCCCCSCRKAKQSMLTDGVQGLQKLKKKGKGVTKAIIEDRDKQARHNVDSRHAWQHQLVC